MLSGNWHLSSRASVTKNAHALYLADSGLEKRRILDFVLSTYTMKAADQFRLKI